MKSPISAGSADVSRIVDSFLRVSSRLYPTVSEQVHECTSRGGQLNPEVVTDNFLASGKIWAEHY